MFFFLLFYIFLSIFSPNFPYHLPFRYDRTGAYRVLVGKTEGNNQLEDLVVDAKIILKRNFTKYNGGVDFTGPFWDRDKWWAVVNAVMNLRFL
jgi:hypothetical protein